MTNDILLDLYAGALRDLEKLMAGLPDERLAEQPNGVRNHPAWTLTHLCVANDFAMGLLFARPVACPADWGPKAKPGSQPLTDRAEYAPAAELMAMLRAQHAAFAQAMRAAPAELFTRPSPEFLRQFAPTLGHIATYMLATHEHYHLAQLLQWKRAACLAE